MTTAPFYIKVNDLQPYYYSGAQDADGEVVNLSGATIYCTMKAARGGTLKIDRQTTGINITDAANGQFEYHWQSGDTDTVGKYYIEFEVNPTSGGKFTLPADPEERAEVQVVSSLDTS
jgi:hypothetical protein